MFRTVFLIGHIIYFIYQNYNSREPGYWFFETVILLQKKGLQTVQKLLKFINVIRKRLTKKIKYCKSKQRKINK